jgi:hypothetical protein
MFVLPLILGCHTSGSTPQIACSPLNIVSVLLVASFADLDGQRR